eukprot:2078412-Pleurochrysis_carterae.AAC.1
MSKRKLLRMRSFTWRVHAHSCLRTRARLRAFACTSAPPCCYRLTTLAWSTSRAKPAHSGIRVLILDCACP